MEIEIKKQKTDITAKTKMTATGAMRPTKRFWYIYESACQKK